MNRSPNASPSKVVALAFSSSESSDDIPVVGRGESGSEESYVDSEDDLRVVAVVRGGDIDEEEGPNKTPVVAQIPPARVSKVELRSMSSDEPLPPVTEEEEDCNEEEGNIDVFEYQEPSVPVPEDPVGEEQYDTDDEMEEDIEREVVETTRVYSVIWLKKFLRKAQIWMTDDDESVFFAKPRKVGHYGMCHVLSTVDGEYDVSLPSCRGILIPSNRGRTFSLRRCVAGVCETQIFGLSFYKVDEACGPEYRGYVGRAFRVVVANSNTYVPTTKTDDLAHVAMNLTGEKRQGTTTYLSKLPVLIDGKLKLRFGNVYMLSSVKNFLIEDEDGKALFEVYKAANGTVTVRAESVFSPIACFGLAIAIISSNLG